MNFKQFEIELVEDWHKAWKWASVQAMVAAGSLQPTWAMIPPYWQQRFPQALITGVTVGLLILGVVGRVIQKKEQELQFESNQQ